MYPLKHLKGRKSSNMNLQRSNEKDEALEFFANLQGQKAEIDQNFSQKLRSDILNESPHENAFLISIKRSLSMFNFHKLPVITASTISLILITFYGCATYLFLQNYPRGLDKNEVLSKILQNNSGSILKSNKSPNALFSVSQTVAAELTSGETRDEASTDISSTLAPIYYNDNYNFFHYVSTYTLGSAASECPVYGSSMNSYSKMETYDFQNYSENNYAPKYKYLAYSSDNKLVDYSLSVDKYRYEYKGGDYALRFEDNNDYMIMNTNTVTNTPGAEESSPSAVEEIAPDTVVLTDEAGTSDGNSATTDGVLATETIPEAKEVIPYYFGENSDVQELTIAGKKYYQVIYSYESPCSYSEERSKNPTISSDTASLITQDMEILFFKDLYEADTYSLVKQEIYLSSIANNNLVITSEYVVEKAEKTTDEIATLFTFDLNKEIKDVPASSYNEASYYPYEKDETKQNAYLEYLKNFLQKKDLAVFAPTDATYVLFETSISDYYDPTKPYYTDRNFYANNNFGQKQYEDYLELYESYSYSQKFSTTYILKDEVSRADDTGYYSISAYDKNLDITNFPEYFFGTNQYTLKDNVTLKINNDNVSATKYTYKYEPENVEGSDGKEITPDYYYGEESYNYLIIFDYQNYKYVINVYTYSSTNNIVEIFSNLKGFDPDNTWIEIETIVKNSFNLHEDYGKVEPQETPSSDGSGSEPVKVLPSSIDRPADVNP